MCQRGTVEVMWRTSPHLSPFITFVSLLLLPLFRPDAAGHPPPEYRHLHSPRRLSGSCSLHPSHPIVLIASFTRLLHVYCNRYIRSTSVTNPYPSSTRPLHVCYTSVTGQFHPFRPLRDRYVRYTTVPSVTQRCMSYTAVASVSRASYPFHNRYLSFTSLHAHTPCYDRSPRCASIKSVTRLLHDRYTRYTPVTSANVRCTTVTSVHPLRLYPFHPLHARFIRAITPAHPLHERFTTVTSAT